MSNYYSQYGEDKIIETFFGSDYVGNLLEIGAWHPIQMSNSRCFIEKGWSAVLVDFCPAAVRALVGEYGNNEKVRVLQAAVSIEDTGLRQFSVSDDAISSDSESFVAKWSQTSGYIGKLWVPLLSLQQLFFQFGGGYDFISIDTEGSSVDLAIHLIRDTQQYPKVLCVEYDGRAMELLQEVQRFGYYITHTNGTNVILVKS